MKIELNTLLVQLLIAIIPILSAFVIRLLNLKASEIKEFTNNKLLDKYIDYAKEIVVKYVIFINQTYVDELKKNNEFTKEKQKKAFELAKEKILAMLNEDAKKAILLLYKDIDAFIEAQIEVTVNNIKELKQ